MPLLTQEQQEHLIKRMDAIVDAARRMRGYQKEYFKFRSSQDLQLSKQWERRLDDLLKDEVEHKKRQQKELF